MSTYATDMLLLMAPDAIKLACWAEDLLVGSAIFAYDARAINRW